MRLDLLISKSRSFQAPLFHSYYKSIVLLGWLPAGKGVEGGIMAPKTSSCCGHRYHLNQTHNGLGSGHGKDTWWSQSSTSYRAGTPKRQPAHKDPAWGTRNPINRLKTCFIGCQTVIVDLFFGHVSSRITLLGIRIFIYCSVVADRPLEKPQHLATTLAFLPRFQGPPFRSLSL